MTCRWCPPPNSTAKQTLSSAVLSLSIGRRHLRRGHGQRIRTRSPVDGSRLSRGWRDLIFRPYYQSAHTHTHTHNSARDRLRYNEEKIKYVKSKKTPTNRRRTQYHNSQYRRMQIYIIIIIKYVHIILYIYGALVNTYIQ